MTPRQQAYEFFVHQGWTPQQSAGIVANLEAESGLRPDAVGDGGQAYGIAQWHPDRQALFAGLLGKPIQGSSLEDQLFFVHAELQRSEKRAGDALAACTTAAAAGACISQLYERPADREGEATKRAARAEQVLASQESLGATIVPPDIPTQPGPSEVAPQPQESPVFALLSTLLPSILPLFAPKAQAAITKMTGAPQDVSGQFLTDLFSKIAQATGIVPPGQPVATPAQAIQAAGAIQTAPPEVVKDVETHALDYLDKLAPLFERAAKADEAENAAMLAGRNAAMFRQQSADPAMVHMVVRNINGQSWMVLGGLVVALIGAAIAKGFWPAMPDYFTVVLALAGPLFGQVMKERGAVIAYYFDGTPAANAGAAIRESIAAAQPKR